MLEKFQTYQQILFDLTANYLEPLETAYARLEYLVSLREQGSGRYAHADLARQYGETAVNEVIEQCHEEVFERLLEMSLNAQSAELRTYLDCLPGDQAKKANDCMKNCFSWAPQKAPSYLKELYDSNMRALLELLPGDKSTARPNS